MNFDSVVSMLREVLNFKLFELNQAPVTMLFILMFLLVFSPFFIFSRLLNRLIVERLLQKFQSEEGTGYIIKWINHYNIVIIGAIVSFQFGGIKLSGLAVIFGLISVGICLVQQTVVDYQQKRSIPGNNGFSVSYSRLKLYGKFDRSFSYFFQATFIQSPVILDARFYYQYASWLTVNAGLFKAPFSSEYLVSAADIDFFNRAQTVNAINIGRQIGMQLLSNLLEDQIAMKIGAFNGNGFDGNNNDNNNLLFAGRLEYENKINFAAAEGNVKAKVNGGASKDENLSLLGGALRNLSGERKLWGADVRFSSDKWLLAAEYLGDEYNPETAADTKPNGYRFTAGMMLNHNSQLLVRWDSFDSGFINSKTDFIILGYNL